LLRSRDLIDRSLSGVRLESMNLQLERLSIRDAIEEVTIAAAVDASSRGISLAVPPVDGELEVHADRHLLIGAVQNMVQNALKFTPRNGRVVLRVREQNGQVLVAVEDECGGLPAGKADDLFGTFQQKGSDRSGLGLGLSISRASASAMGGTLEVRDLPGKGCIFTLALPRLGATASAVRPSARELVRTPPCDPQRPVQSEEDPAANSSWCDEGGAQ
jgi:signal transduction histidine kinase